MMVRQRHHHHHHPSPTTTTTPPPPKKKKGRPSLLDLQQRKLQQQQNPKHNPTPPSPPPHRNNSPPRRTRSLRGTPSLPAQFLLGSDSDSDSYNSHPSSDSDDDRLSKKTRRLPPLLKKNNNNALHNIIPPQGEKGSKATDTRNNETKMVVVAGPTYSSTSAATMLPDKKLLLLILDKLQKKDTRGVFAEPVDPEELPDYHELIETPMDFGTVRKKLDSGRYKTLQQLEDDVYLISSNAMQYNPPSTIFFRQARSIQELAKKEFEPLRLEFGQNEPPPKPRRGRPPGSKNSKKVVETSPVDRVVTESPSDATPTTQEEDASRSGSYNLRKGPSLYRFPRNFENFFDFSVPAYKPISMKYGKKPCGSEENRRETYGLPGQFDSDQDSLSAFGGSEKQLIAVGLASDHGYARSLAQYGADLGPVVWKIVSKKIRSVLPPGVDFGPGWVGETTAGLRPLSPLPEKSVLPNYLLQDSFKSEQHNPSTSGFINSASANNPSASPSEISVEAREFGFDREYSSLKGVSGLTVPSSSFQIQSDSVYPRMNGFSFGPASHSQDGMARQISSPFVNPLQFPKNPALESSSYDTSRSSPLSRMNSPPVDLHGMLSTDMGAHGMPYWQNLSVQERWDRPYPAELNGGLQASGSRSSSLQIGSPQLELGLQL